MIFEQYWQKLNDKKKIDGDVKLSPVQFEKMLKQAYDIGYSAGVERTKTVYDMLKQYGGNANADKVKDSAYEELFGKSGDGDVADFLKGIFGGKKN
jgi:hypothetical protein